MKTKKIIFLFNGFQFFFSLLLWVPIFYEYQKRIGLSDSEIFRIQSLYYLIFCLLEIPTGTLADKIGHKTCLIFGSISLIAANLLVPFFPNYNGFLFHFILVACARSFISGAASAYLYQTLSERNELHVYKETEGKARAFGLIGKIFCWGAVGYLMEWHLSLPYWITAIFALFSLFFAMKLPNNKNLPLNLASTEKLVNKDGQLNRSQNNFFNIIQVIFKSPYLFLLMLQGIALFVMGRIVQVNLFQPILESKGFQVVSYGMIMALMTAFEALGSFKSEWVKRFLNDQNAIFAFTFILGVSFLLLSINIQGIYFNPKWATLFSLALFSYVIGISYPIQKKLINDAIPAPQMRASLLSVESIIDRGVNSWVATLLGPILLSGHLSYFLQKSAVVAIFSTCLIALLIYFVRKKYEDSIYFKN